MSSDIDQLITLFFSLRQQMQERGKVPQKTRKLTLEQIHALGYICRHKEPLMKDVAAYLGVTAPSATVSVDILVAAGLVRRIADSKDRRTIRLAITVKGKAELAVAKARITKKMKGLLKNLNKEDRQHLITILKKFSTTNL